MTPPRGPQRLLLPLADAFMVAMLSRPPSGTLATTRVTTVSIALAAASFLVFVAVGLVLLVSGSAMTAVVGVLLILFGLWSLTLALFGVLQRTSGA
ncbi:MAG TPA: hypothetical protein VNV65_09740 [Candidatus Solibacter sp.]|nr:hypothetical protein [Candidatus Solibacter sp.]